MQTAIKAKRIVDGTGAVPLENAILLIDGNVIIDVGTEEWVRIPEGTEVITLPDNETLLPGLIDGHNHPALCWYQHSLFGRKRIRRSSLPPGRRGGSRHRPSHQDVYEGVSIRAGTWILGHACAKRRGIAAWFR